MANKRKVGARSAEPPTAGRKPGGLAVPVGLSFLHYVPGSTFCLSRLGRDESRAALDCLRKLTTLNWGDILRQSGKGPNKTGLAWTFYADHVLRGATRPAQLTATIPIGAVRASQKSRVFGAYDAGLFFVLFFDPDHAIAPA